MKSKIGYWIFLSLCFYFPQLSAQVESYDNLEQKFIRYGFGFSNFGSNSDLISIDFDLGYERRLGEHFSTVVNLNFGLAPEDVVDIGGMQADFSLIGFVSPTKNTEKYVFKIGFGPSFLAAYDTYFWDEDGSGVFPGFCLVGETGFFSERKNKRFLMKFHWGRYTSNEFLAGISFVNQISIAQLKRDRANQKRKLMID